MNIKDKSYGVILILRKKNEDDKFLILHQTKGHWSFPKGHKENNETPKEAAVRELFEETGISDVFFAELPSIKETYSFEYKGDNYNKMNEYFIAYTNNDEVKIQDSEVQNYKWATYEEALKTVTFPEIKEVLKYAKEYTDINGISRKFATIDLRNFSSMNLSHLPLVYKSKAVLINSKNEIVLVNVPSKNKLSIPGGKMEEGEDIYSTLVRECKEETGYDVEIIAPLGYVKLYRKKYISITFVFIVNALGKPGPLSLMSDELSEGHEIIYKNLADTILEAENYANDNFLSALTFASLKETEKYLSNGKAK